MARPLLPARVRENIAKPPNHPVSRTLAKNQSFARLPQRFAARRAFSIQNSVKTHRNSRNSSRQGYASNFRHTANLSDNALRACWRHAVPLAGAVIFLALVFPLVIG